MAVEFSCPQGLVVRQAENGVLSWSGLYDGMPVKLAIPLDDGRRCVLLLDPGANRKLVFENLFCLDSEGRQLWVAKLPSLPDVFLAVEMTNEGIRASTYGGF